MLQNFATLCPCQSGPPCGEWKVCSFLVAVLGGVLNPNSFGGFLTIFSLFVNNCKWDFEQCLIKVLSNIIAKHI